MDYEFKKNSLDGQYYCQCSMGHEIVGRWLQEEIGAEKIRIMQVLQVIELAKKHYDREHCFTGKEISVIICGDEVIVQDNVLLSTADATLNEEEFPLYESESCGCCGIDDFERLIRQWADFTNH
ncbi:hypothetical protein VA7868_01596 [Vibrio aerogenes CECT 7868]|uniref:Uncharacterized protein n=1 Tax=Vibrio aerogenes CECT 7868 TaxID=1216006 RepID=A0A1M5YB93_9VIBR|nr:YacL family protein [Vibrio aerogenes]SHI09297.1 hypothetical protein VA7868_01596 [Vibrio aerogenes CECT 7868]